MNTVLNACAPVINAAATNCNDVTIVITICIAIVIIVLMIAVAACIWHCQSLWAARKMKEQEWAAEKEKMNSSKQQVTAAPEKTNSQKTTELLKELAAMVKPKDGDFNKDTIDQMVELYKQLKKDFDDEKSAE